LWRLGCIISKLLLPQIEDKLKVGHVMLIHDLQPPQFTKRGEYQFSKQFIAISGEPKNHESLQEKVT
jgi:hypothetical protein